MPNFLYKYKSNTNLEYLLDIIKNKRFFMSNRDILNDPLEGICDMCFGFAGCSYYVNTPKLHPQYDEIVNQFKILSLSEDCKNIPMWAHYANDFDGVCIEIRTDKHLREAYPVDYKGDVVEAMKCGTMEECAIASLKKKAPGWSYEREWRVILKSEKESKEYLNLDSDEIARVLIGYRTSTVMRNVISEICRNEGIAVQVAYVNPYQYSVEFMELEKYNRLMEDIETGKYEGSLGHS